jgi:hypothetical protein
MVSFAVKVVRITDRQKLNQECIFVLRVNALKKSVHHTFTRKFYIIASPLKEEMRERESETEKES